MFGFFESQESKMRDNASNWLELADKVWNFRRDRLSERESGELTQATGGLRRLLKDRAETARLKAAIEALEGVLSRTGGAIYPKSSLVENVEFLLVAAIVIFGLRTYFVQPFKIPTNSMWPSYYGMKAESFPPGAPAPNLAERAFRFAAYGAIGRTVVAPRDGEVSVPLVVSQGVVRGIAYATVPGKSWGVLPTKVREYTFYVDGSPVSFQVPSDFSEVDEVFMGTYFPNPADLDVQYQKALGDRRVEEVNMNTYRMPVGRTVRAGDPILRFDIMTGDQLFVDRISYNFVRPRVGEGFVFRTDNIPEIAQVYGIQYFIKRLIGTPGDRIEIRAPGIYRNGSPIAGSEAFKLNAGMVGDYRGYVNALRSDPRYVQGFEGETITVPEKGYLALGDNSHNSFDGRYWGFVPEKDVVGKPLFIYYPFTRRWGTAR
jgi:signal peptidase I